MIKTKLRYYANHTWYDHDNPHHIYELSTTGRWKITKIDGCPTLWIEVYADYEDTKHEHKVGIFKTKKYISTVKIKKRTKPKFMSENHLHLTIHEEFPIQECS